MDFEEMKRVPRSRAVTPGSRKFVLSYRRGGRCDVARVFTSEQRAVAFACMVLSDAKARVARVRLDVDTVEPVISTVDGSLSWCWTNARADWLRLAGARLGLRTLLRRPVSRSGG